MKNKIKNKIATLVMCAVVGIGTTFAETPFAGGTGTYNDPFLIETPAQLDSVRNHLDAHFALTSDLDMAGVEFRPIGRNAEGVGSVPFTGSLDGRDHIIRNLTIVDSAQDVALFSRIELAVEDSGQIAIQNLGLVNSNIYNRITAPAANRTATFVGTFIRGTMVNIFADSAEVVSSIGITGGLIATLQAGRLSESWFSGSVTAVGNIVGGLVGTSSGSGTLSGSIIENSYSTGSIQANTNVGGIVGNASHTSTIRNVWSSASVRANGNGNAGGIAGTITQQTRLETSVSLAPTIRSGNGNAFRIGTRGGTAAAFFVNNLALATTELWSGVLDQDTDTLITLVLAELDTVNGQSITMAQAQTQATFTTAPFAWDFEYIWKMNPNEPRLPVFIWQVDEENGYEPEPPPSSINPSLPASVAVSVSPNPTFGEVSIAIENAEIKQVLIFTMTGQQVFSTTHSEFNIEHLSRGIYVVHIITDVGNFVSRIIRR